VLIVPKLAYLGYSLDRLKHYLAFTAKLEWFFDYMGGSGKLEIGWIVSIIG